MSAVELEVELDPETELVRRWRVEELERAGYAPENALLLAELRHVDLHGATSLLRDGCPPALALRILV
ncbi:MAG TPA: hypothetical protein VK915_14530 [Gaiellaceae bacterium]|nr:hypothetical protein [Gaiellaceae bacterium]